MDSSSLITSLVTGFGLALPFGYFFERFLRTPALVGYVFAGLSVSAFPGLPPVDKGMLDQLAEIGVMLLMFGVGLHFSVRDLLRVKSVAVPGALLQMLFSTALGSVFASVVWDWNVGKAVMFGLTISCASTVVVTKALEIRRLTTDMDGQAVIGWLVVQDLVSVLFLVLLPPFAQVIHGAPGVSLSAVAVDVAKTLAGVAVFIVLMLVAGRKALPWLLKQVAATGSGELFTLSVLGCAIVIAYGASAIFHVSFALGAFFAGMVMQESRYAHRAATNSLPLRDAFSVLFFVSVGLMLDWHIFLERPWEVLVVVLIIMGATTSAAFSLVVLLKWPLKTAVTVGACLGQIGEFSYILAQQGISLGLADASLMSLIVAASIVTIALNPLLFAAAPAAERALARRFRWAMRAELRQAPDTTLPADTPREYLGGQVIVAGCDDMTEALFSTLKQSGRRTIVVCPSKGPVEQLKEAGFRVIAGDAADPTVLVQAHVATGAVLVIAEDDPLRARQIYNTARALNKTLRIIVVIRHLETAAVFEEDDKHLDILCETLVAGMALAERTMERLEAFDASLRRGGKAPERDAASEEAEEAEDGEASPSARRRQQFEAEYQRTVEEVRRGGQREDEAVREAEESVSTLEGAAGGSSPQETAQEREEALEDRGFKVRAAAGVEALTQSMRRMRETASEGAKRALSKLRLPSWRKNKD